MSGCTAQYSANVIGHIAKHTATSRYQSGFRILKPHLSNERSIVTPLPTRRSSKCGLLLTCALRIRIKSSSS